MGKNCAPCRPSPCAVPCPAPCPVPCPVPKPCPAKCCVSGVVCIEKNLLTIAKVPLVDPTFSSLVLVYEIVLTNKGCTTVAELSLVDTFAGLLNSTILALTITATTCNDNLTINAVPDILVCGSILDPTRSSLPPCSTSRVILTLSIAAQAGSVIVNQILNTMTLNGAVQYMNDCGWIKGEKLEPISIKSTIWEDSDGVLLSA